MRKHSSPLDSDLPDNSPSGSEQSLPLPGYFDMTLIHEFMEQYSPGNYMNCDTIMTEPMLRDMFNAHRDQDMTFTDPWIQYKQSLLDHGYSFRPNAELHCSVMYLKECQPDYLEEEL